MGDKKGRQDVGKADAPSNIGTRVGIQDLRAEMFFSDSAEQRLGTSVQSSQDAGVQFGVVKSDAERAMVVLRDAVQGKFPNLSSGRRTHHPTQAHMWGDNGRQVETRAGKADTPTNKKETRRETGRQRETR